MGPIGTALAFAGASSLKRCTQQERRRAALSKSTHKKMVIWAVDPFDPETSLKRSSVIQLTQWARKSGFLVQPVYIARPSEGGASGSAMVNNILEQKELESYIRGLRLSGLLAPKLLFSDRNTKSSAVEKLLEFAESTRTGLIALSSHGRGGLKRLLLGSFAEGVLSESKWPMLFLNQLAGEKLAAKVDTALFPTDFSSASKNAFAHFLPEAMALGLKVTLFHLVTNPIAIQAVEAPSAFYPKDYFSGQEKWANATGNRWLKTAREQGVEAELLLKNGQLGLFSARQIKAAAKSSGAGLIVMATKSRPIDRIFFGSAALDLFRDAPCPVWFYGPKALLRIAKKRPTKSRPLSQARKGKSQEPAAGLTPS